MIRCINCGVYCKSDEAVYEGKEGVILAYTWFCDACYEAVSENIERLAAEKEVYNKESL
jgi:hypothetical protein